MKDRFLGVDLKGIIRVRIQRDELGFDRPGPPMDHYWLDMNWPLVIFSEDEPQAIVNIGMETASIVCYVQLRWFDNVQTITAENVPPGYEKIILIWTENPILEDKTYDN